MIKFIKLTAAQYAALVDAKTVNANYFYLTTDTNEFYLGERHLTDQDLSSYLTSVEAKDNSIVVSDNKKIGVKISSKTGNNLSLETESGKEGLYVNVPAATDYSVTIDDTTTTTGYLKSYTISQLGETIGVIDIPKDLVVTSGEVVVDPQGQPAGTYIKLTIANQTNPIYINVADLVDAYTAASGASQVQLAISNTNEISATLVDGGISTAKIADDAVTTDKLADSIVTSLGKADSAVQSVTETAAAGTNGTITVDGSEVAVKGLGSAAYTASSAYDAAGAASDAETAAKSYADGLASNYATAAQGAKADSAVQSVIEGTTDGTIKVDGTAVAVHGLGTAAYAASTDFDAAGSASTVQTTLIGSSSDLSTANTIYGAKKYAESILEWETYSASV